MPVAAASPERLSTVSVCAAVRRLGPPSFVNVRSETGCWPRERACPTPGCSWRLAAVGENERLRRGRVIPLGRGGGPVGRAGGDEGGAGPAVEVDNEGEILNARVALRDGAVIDVEESGEEPAALQRLDSCTRNGTAAGGPTAHDEQRHAFPFARPACAPSPDGASGSRESPAKAFRRTAWARRRVSGKGPGFP